MFFDENFNFTFQLGLCSLGDRCPLAHHTGMEPGMRSNEQPDNNVNGNANDMAKNKYDERTISIKTLPRPPQDWLNLIKSVKPETTQNPSLPGAKQDYEQVLHFLKSGSNQNHQKRQIRDSHAFESFKSELSIKSTDEGQMNFSQQDIRSRPETSDASTIAEYGDAYSSKNTIQTKFKGPVVLQDFLKYVK